jgi:type II secretory pathway pseudopilin PulG
MKTKASRPCGGGFAYLVLLLWLSIMGAVLAALGPGWAFESRREREQEFVFRATQYRRAIASYAEPVNLNGCSNLRELPQKLEDLLEDHRCGLVRHHLRQLYEDPITRSATWGLLKQLDRIRGVYSDSALVPVRHIEGVGSYRDWVFAVDRPLLDATMPPAARGRPVMQ